MPRGLTLSFWRVHLDAAIYLIVGVVLFVFFLISTFPYGRVVASMLADSGFNLAYSGQSLNLPLGAELHDVRLSPAGQPGGAPLLQSPALSLSPAIASALIGNPGIKLGAKLYDGMVYAAVHRRGQAADISFKFDNLKIDRFPGLARFGAAAMGTVTGRGRLSLAGSDLSRAGGNLRFHASGVEVRIARGMPPIRLGGVSGVLELGDGLLAVKSLRSDGRDLKFDARGTVTIARDPADSRLDLTFRLEPSASGRSRIGFLLNLLPHPPGPEPYYLRGTLGEPSLG